MFKKLISNMYHKYVCKPKSCDGYTLEQYLEICKEEYYLRKFYNINTFEHELVIKDIAWVKKQINHYYNDCDKKFNNCIKLLDIIPKGRKE